MPSSIPLVRPYFSGNELTYVERLFETRRLGSGGAYTRRAETILADITGSEHALLVNSCSSALELAAVLLQLEPGDEVIFPSYTFVTTVSSFVRLGAKPVFVDIRADTCNIDETAVEALVTPRTRAIVAVHYAGVPAEMDVLSEIAQRHGLVLIEDAAQALSSHYRGRPVGSLGQLAAFSFHETKNFICGEGGALVVNDERFVDRAYIIRDKGTNRRQFQLGQVDKYTWVDMGASYALSEISAAVLNGQLEAVEDITLRRKERYERYTSSFADLEANEVLTLPVIPEWCESNYHLFHVLLRDYGRRAELFAHLKEHGIDATFHYVPLHSSRQGLELGGGSYDLPVTDRVSRSVVRLPLFPDLTVDEQDRVIEALRTFFANG